MNLVVNLSQKWFLYDQIPSNDRTLNGERIWNKKKLMNLVVILSQKLFLYGGIPSNKHTVIERIFLTHLFLFFAYIRFSIPTKSSRKLRRGRFVTKIFCAFIVFLNPNLDFIFNITHFLYFLFFKFLYFYIIFEFTFRMDIWCTNKKIKKLVFLKVIFIPC